MEVSAYMYMPEVEYSENIGICRPGGPYWETLYPKYGQRSQAEIRFQDSTIFRTTGRPQLFFFSTVRIDFKATFELNLIKAF